MWEGGSVLRVMPSTDASLPSFYALLLFILCSAWAAGGKEGSGSDTHGGVWSRENLLPPLRCFCVCGCSPGVSAQMGVAKKLGGPGWVEFPGPTLGESWAGCGSGAPSSVSAKGHFGSSGCYFQVLLPKRNVLTEALRKGQRTGGEQAQAPWSAL